MVSYVEPSQRYSIIEAVVHMVNRDFDSLAELYRRMGFIPGDVDSAPIVSALEVSTNHSNYAHCTAEIVCGFGYHVSLKIYLNIC